ncbi:hypothetical protein [Bacteroides sp. 519]|uniref:hypothetical protein n=1 Tax=Bacteroides sp. 519 TaxID=2302937 RepID=UPI0013D638A0|nr:hypothetical protein [Bacteroides sp. 519]NDV58938.1 hypothetical protein [Bacteroides sp. 519]
MSHRINLSSSFNTSLGFAPAIITILLGEFMPKDLAIYIGTLAGVVYSAFNLYKKPKPLPSFILYTVTVILAVFSLISLFKITSWPNNSLAMALEICIVLFWLPIYLLQNRMLSYFRQKAKSTGKRYYMEASVSAIVSIRITLIIAFIHLAIFTILVLFTHTMSTEIMWVLQVLLPILVFVSSIVFNQFAIRDFNRSMSTMEFVSVVNEKGDVIGKAIRNDVKDLKSDVTVPIVRIAVESQGMLFLARNNRVNMVECDKTDTPLEDYILYKESIENAVKRVLAKAFPAHGELDPRFSIKYKFKDDKRSRLVYLFILHLDDDSILCDNCFVGGKLWMLQQIEDNLNKNFFSGIFEYEFEHLKEVVEVRERYK